MQVQNVLESETVGEVVHELMIDSSGVVCTNMKDSAVAGLIENSKIISAENLHDLHSDNSSSHNPSLLLLSSPESQINCQNKFGKEKTSNTASNYPKASKSCTKSKNACQNEFSHPKTLKSLGIIFIYKSTFIVI